MNKIILKDIIIDKTLLEIMDFYHDLQNIFHENYDFDKLEETFNDDEYSKKERNLWEEEYGLTSDEDWNVIWKDFKDEYSEREINNFLRSEFIEMFGEIDGKRIFEYINNQGYLFGDFKLEK